MMQHKESWILAAVMVAIAVGCQRKQVAEVAATPQDSVIVFADTTARPDTAVVASVEVADTVTVAVDEAPQSAESDEWIYLELDELEIMIPNATDSIAKAINEISVSVNEDLAQFQLNDSDAFFYLEDRGYTRSLWLKATFERSMFLPLEKNRTRIGYVTIGGRELDLVCSGDIQDGIYKKCRKTGNSKTVRYWNNPMLIQGLGEQYRLNVTDTAIVLREKYREE